MNASPQVGQWGFRVFTIIAPVFVAALFEVQRQIDSGGDFAWRPIASAVIGAIFVAYAHFARSGTERAEARAEIITGKDQDGDHLAEGAPTR